MGAGRVAAADYGAAVADAAWLTSALPGLLRRIERSGAEQASLTPITATLSETGEGKMPPHPGVPKMTDVMAVLSETLPHHSIAVERVEPDGDGRLRVWFGRTEFAAVVDWLWHLEAELGLRVEALQTSALQEPGSVRGNLVVAAEGASYQ